MGEYHFNCISFGLQLSAIHCKPERKRKASKIKSFFFTIKIRLFLKKLLQWWFFFPRMLIIFIHSLVQIKDWSLDNSFQIPIEEYCSQKSTLSLHQFYYFFPTRNLAIWQLFFLSIRLYLWYTLDKNMEWNSDSMWLTVYGTPMQSRAFPIILKIKVIGHHA